MDVRVMDWISSAKPPSVTSSMMASMETPCPITAVHTIFCTWEDDKTAQRGAPGKSRREAWAAR